MYMLPKWILTNSKPSLYDSESVTVVEMTAKLYGAMEELIKEYNGFVDKVNEGIIQNEVDIQNQINEFTKCINELTSNFIEQIETKISLQDIKIAEAERYMKNNIEQTAEELINQALADGGIKVTTNYDDQAESLVIGGGV